MDGKCADVVGESEHRFSPVFMEGGIRVMLESNDERVAVWFAWRDRNPKMRAVEVESSGVIGRVLPMSGVRPGSDVDVLYLCRVAPGNSKKESSLG